MKILNITHKIKSCLILTERLQDYINFYHKGCPHTTLFECYELILSDISKLKNNIEDLDGLYFNKNLHTAYYLLNKLKECFLVSSEKSFNLCNLIKKELKVFISIAGLKQNLLNTNNLIQ